MDSIETTPPTGSNTPVFILHGIGKLNAIDTVTTKQALAELLGIDVARLHLLNYSVELDSSIFHKAAYRAAALMTGEARQLDKATRELPLWSDRIGDVMGYFMDRQVRKAIESKVRAQIGAVLPIGGNGQFHLVAHSLGTVVALNLAGTQGFYGYQANLVLMGSPVAWRFLRWMVPWDRITTMTAATIMSLSGSRDSVAKWGVPYLPHASLVVSSSDWFGNRISVNDKADNYRHILAKDLEHGLLDYLAFLGGHPQWKQSVG